MKYGLVWFEQPPIVFEVFSRRMKAQGPLVIINWKYLYDHLMNTRIFTWIIYEIFKWAPKNMM